MDKLQFKFHRDYYDCGNLYKKANVEFQSGLTVLVGCNGSGKTTMIRQIKEICREKDIPYFSFDNLVNGGGNNFYSLLNGGMGLSGGIEDLCSLISSSEGERITQNIGLYSDKLHGIISKAQKEGKSEVVMTYDAIDSGLSIDNICEVKEVIKKLIDIHKKLSGIDIFAIISANSFEMANGENCFDVQNSKYVTFNFGYNEYKDFILNSRKLKAKRIAKHIRDYELKQEKEKSKEEEEKKNGETKSEKRRSSKRNRFTFSRDC